MLFLKSPSPAQIEAGNYKKKHIILFGLGVSIENRKGSVRKGVDPNGKEWRVKMKYDYGYFKGSMGVDKDHVDCYVGPDKESEKVFIIHQRKIGDWKKYDEDKVMICFSTRKQAEKAFLQHYNDKRFLGPVTEMGIDEFKVKVLATKDNPKMIKAILFFKSSVKTHTRKLKSGKVITISGYSNSKTKKPDSSHGRLRTDDKTLDMFDGDGNLQDDLFAVKERKDMGKLQDIISKDGVSIVKRKNKLDIKNYEGEFVFYDKGNLFRTLGRNNGYSRVIIPEEWNVLDDFVLIGTADKLPEKGFYNKKELKEKGWTDKLIGGHLGEPHAKLSSGSYSAKYIKPTNVWAKHTVDELEASDAINSQLTDSKAKAAKRTEKLEAAAKQNSKELLSKEFKRITVKKATHGKMQGYAVSAPYSQDFISGAKSKKAKWDGETKHWFFPAGKEQVLITFLEQMDSALDDELIAKEHAGQALKEKLNKETKALGDDVIGDGSYGPFSVKLKDGFYRVSFDYDPGLVNKVKKFAQGGAGIKKYDTDSKKWAVPVTKTDELKELLDSAKSKSIDKKQRKGRYVQVTDDNSSAYGYMPGLDSYPRIWVSDR